MDQVKIGKFILEIRKQRGMTQKELAEKIGVSDKTISKWECGNSIPDITYLEALCNSLNISVNELLSGQCLASEIYSEKAEENIMALMKENAINKKGALWKFALGIVLCLTSFIFLSVICDGNVGVLLEYYDLPSLFIYVLLSVGEILLLGKNKKENILTFLQKVSIPNGIVITLFELVLILRRLDTIGALGAHLAVCLLTLFYSIVVYLIVCVVKAKMTDS